MGYRVDSIQVTMEVMVEFVGYRTLTFRYVPGADDPLVKLALAKNDELVLAEVKAGPPADRFFG